MQDVISPEAETKPRIKVARYRFQEKELRGEEKLAAALYRRAV
jgi:hypothetical protein